MDYLVVFLVLVVFVAVLRVFFWAISYLQNKINPFHDRHNSE